MHMTERWKHGQRKPGLNAATPGTATYAWKWFGAMQAEEQVDLLLGHVGFLHGHGHELVGHVPVATVIFVQQLSQVARLFRRCVQHTAVLMQANNRQRPQLVGNHTTAPRFKHRLWCHATYTAPDAYLAPPDLASVRPDLLPTFGNTFFGLGHRSCAPLRAVTRRCGVRTCAWGGWEALRVRCSSRRRGTCST